MILHEQAKLRRLVQRQRIALNDRIRHAHGHVVNVQVVVHIVGHHVLLHGSHPTVIGEQRGVVEVLRVMFVLLVIKVGRPGHDEEGQVCISVNLWVRVVLRIIGDVSDPILGAPVVEVESFAVSGESQLAHVRHRLDGAVCNRRLLLPVNGRGPHDCLRRQDGIERRVRINAGEHVKLFADKISGRRRLVSNAWCGKVKAQRRVPVSVNHHGIWLLRTIVDAHEGQTLRQHVCDLHRCPFRQVRLPSRLLRCRHSERVHHEVAGPATKLAAINRRVPRGIRDQVAIIIRRHYAIELVGHPVDGLGRHRDRCRVHVNRLVPAHPLGRYRQLRSVHDGPRRGGEVQLLADTKPVLRLREVINQLMVHLVQSRRHPVNCEVSIGR